MPCFIFVHLFLWAALKQGAGKTRRCCSTVYRVRILHHPSGLGPVTRWTFSVNLHIYQQMLAPGQQTRLPWKINPKWLSREGDFLQPREVHAFRLKNVCFQSHLVGDGVASVAWKPAPMPHLGMGYCFPNGPRLSVPPCICAIPTPHTSYAPPFYFFLPKFKK